METFKLIKTVNNLFQLKKPIKVPAYQRAYAWEEKQINQFINDLIEFIGRDGYYFGHFILEDNNESELEIIDGQQRLTTFVLFLMVCKVFNKELPIENYISNFKTVEYDSDNLGKIHQQLNLEKEWTLENFELNDKSQTTLSLKKIIEALDIFKKAFIKGTLNKDFIEQYVTVVTKAHASAHITNGKEVAVQIFELHNTRGIQLNTIEKVKAKLMKAVYKHNTTASANQDVKVIQDAFAEIFRLEEKVASQSFRGDLQLDELLLSHLRVIDDGSKLISPQDIKTFHSPKRDGKREEVILKYIDEKTEVSEKINPSECVEYAIKIANEFLLSTKIICEELPELDKINSLIGDSLILEKDISTEFYLILCRRLEKAKLTEEHKLFVLWEKLLFTRNFHNKFHGLWYEKRDDFGRIFQEMSNENVNIVDLLKTYLEDGFRSDDFDNILGNVKQYLKDNENEILKNAFYWNGDRWREKIAYSLYKFEVNNKCDILKLREFMKSNRSIEHILPQEWEWIWITNDPNNLNEEDRKAEKNIKSFLNGIGNLLIVSRSINSGLSNNHPKDKVYECCSGGTYTEHNENRDTWVDHKEWEEIITKRGKKIYDFVMQYFFES